MYVLVKHRQASLPERSFSSMQYIRNEVKSKYVPTREQYDGVKDL